ncbi:MAG: hypothetical protein ACTSU7_11335, partial [Candidatus Heimdallarchaeaceae archaeon]
MKPTISKPFPPDFNMLLDEIHESILKTLEPIDTDKETYLLTHELRDVILAFTMKKSYSIEPDYDMIDAM